MLYDNFFRITATTYQNVGILANGDPDPFAMQYRTDQNDQWTDYTANDFIQLQGEGSWVEFRNTSGTFSKDENNYYVILSETGDPFHVSGNLKSLISYDNEHQTPNSWAFYRLFYESSVNDCQNLMLGCDDLEQYITGCYYEMFSDCSNIMNMPQFVSYPGAIVRAGPQTFQYMFFGCQNLMDRPERPDYFTIEINGESACQSMFYGCAMIYDASWITIQLVYGGFACQQMFSECRSLGIAPEIQGQTDTGSYTQMFYNCVSLTQAPSSLPAENLSQSCYSGMFQGCSQLSQAPLLPATTLDNNCYENMFKECSQLTVAPQLPATVLKENCYSSMFAGCTALRQAPALPATTLAGYCYYYMFYGCSSLTQAPVLPATTLASNCYERMFSNCQFTQAPELPATTLANYCYSQMFYGCSQLTAAPELPATTLASYCYSSMFYGCSSLTQAPVLPATTLASYCYEQMFYGCSSLNSVVFGGSKVPGAAIIKNWLNGVSATGTFYYTDENLDVSGFPRNENGIPAGWTIQYLGPKPQLVFSINGRAVASLTINGRNVAKFN